MCLDTPNKWIEVTHKPELRRPNPEIKNVSNKMQQREIKKNKSEAITPNGGKQKTELVQHKNGSLYTHAIPGLLMTERCYSVCLARSQRSICPINHGHSIRVHTSAPMPPNTSLRSRFDQLLATAFSHSPSMTSCRMDFTAM